MVRCFGGLLLGSLLPEFGCREEVAVYCSSVRGCRGETMATDKIRIYRTGVRSALQKNGYLELFLEQGQRQDYGCFRKSGGQPTQTGTETALG